MLVWLLNQRDSHWRYMFHADRSPECYAAAVKDHSYAPGSTVGASLRGKYIAALAVYQAGVFRWGEDFEGFLDLPGHSSVEEWRSDLLARCRAGVFVVEDGLNEADRVHPHFLGADNVADRARSHAWALGWRRWHGKRKATARRVPWAVVTDGLGRVVYRPDYEAGFPGGLVASYGHPVPKEATTVPPEIIAPDVVLARLKLEAGDLRLLGWG